MAELKIYIKVDTQEQLNEVLKSDFTDNIIIPIDMINSLNALSSNEETFLPASLQDKLLIALPNIVRLNYRDEIIALVNKYKDLASGFLVSSYDALGIVINQNIPREKIIADYNLYSYNDYAVKELKSMGCGFLTVPLELKKAELSHRDNSNSIMVIYGHAPYMIMAQCMNKNNNKCTKKAEDIRLIDRMGKKVFVKNYCGYCYNILFNPMATDLMSEISYLKSIGINAFRIDFSVENSETTRSVLKHLSSELALKNMDFDSKKFTRGHYKNGVE